MAKDKLTLAKNKMDLVRIIKCANGSFEVFSTRKDELVATFYAEVFLRSVLEELFGLDPFEPIPLEFDNTLSALDRVSQQLSGKPDKSPKSFSSGCHKPLPRKRDADGWAVDLVKYVWRTKDEKQAAKLDNEASRSIFVERSFINGEHVLYAYPYNEADETYLKFNGWVKVTSE